MQLKNPRLTVKERNLLKGAIRRVFARSELRRQVINSCLIDHEDNSRPRVKKWGICAVCKVPTPKSYLVVDHINPVVPIDTSFEEMSLDTLVNNMWCDIINLQPICDTCHIVKSSAENKARRERKKADGRQVVKRPSKTGRKRNPSRSIKRAAVHRAKKACRLSIK